VEKITIDWNRDRKITSSLDDLEKVIEYVVESFKSELKSSTVIEIQRSGATCNVSYGPMSSLISRESNRQFIGYVWDILPDDVPGLLADDVEGTSMCLIISPPEKVTVVTLSKPVDLYDRF
jgi:hypothetical protein